MDTDGFMTKLSFGDGDVFVDLTLLNILAAYNYLYLPDQQFYFLSDLLLMLLFLSYKPKSTFYPCVLFLAMADILVGWAGHRTHLLN